MVGLTLRPMLVISAPDGVSDFSIAYYACNVTQSYLIWMLEPLISIPNIYKHNHRSQSLHN